MSIEPAAIAVFDDLHQIAPLVGGEPVRAPVVEDQQIGLDQGAEQAGEATVTVGKFEIGEQPRHAGVRAPCSHPDTPSGRARKITTTCRHRTGR